MDINRVFTAKEKSKEILDKPGVVGMGIGYKTKGQDETDDLSVIVMVEQKMPVEALSAGELIPPHIYSAPTDVVEVGHLRPLKARTDKWRPAPGGVSIGHYKITAGTLGIVVAERETGNKLILSNNHVLANSNDATLGDPIYQPGPADGGRSEDTIAALYNFIPIDFGIEEGGTCPFAETYLKIGNWIAGLFNSRHVLSAKRVNPQAINYMDAALAIPNEQSLIQFELEDIGYVSGTADAELGLAVQKSGRTTELTSGKITMVHSTVKVSYGKGTATFEDQVITDAMSAGGDSGSLLVDKDKTAVGLLFAGSNQITIYNSIKRVLDALHVNI